MDFETSRPTPTQFGDELYFEDMGRPIDDLPWLERFDKNLWESIDGREIKLSLRETPGIIYALGSEVKRAARKDIRLRGVANTPEVIDILVDQEIIDGFLATKAISVAVSRLDLKEVKSRDEGVYRFDLRAKVNDVPISVDDGTTISEERYSVQKALKQGSDRPSEDKSRVLNLVLGTLSCGRDFKPIRRESLDYLLSSLDNSLSLGPIGKMIAYF